MATTSPKLVCITNPQAIKPMESAPSTSHSWMIQSFINSNQIKQKQLLDQLAELRQEADNLRSQLGKIVSECSHPVVKFDQPPQVRLIDSDAVMFRDFIATCQHCTAKVRACPRCASINSEVIELSGNEGKFNRYLTLLGYQPGSRQVSQWHRCIDCRLELLSFTNQFMWDAEDSL